MGGLAELVPRAGELCPGRMGLWQFLCEGSNVRKFGPEVLKKAGGDGRPWCEAELCAVAQRLRRPFGKRGKVDQDGPASPCHHGTVLLTLKWGIQLYDTFFLVGTSYPKTSCFLCFLVKV